ncbi:MAG TPA: substrate-binding domain-containing protein [Candidatus Limnocylindria bacterium]|nr:substrate-binding domain-containing protein [Candidatus Limnocylindria bacterium]
MTPFSERLLALSVGAVTLLAACGGAPAGAGNADADTSPGAGAEVAGEIFVSGSSTVEPITSRVAELFAEQTPGFSYTVEGPGTGDGFELFCNGETDISDASRAIDEEEAQACADSGVEYVELRVAYDGLSVITSAANDGISCLSFLDLYALLGPESEGFESWSDANQLASELESELGDEFGATNAPYPDAPLIVTAPGEESGTFDSFVEIVVAGIGEARLESGAISEDQAETTRPDYTASANDNSIIDGIGGAESSLGWVGYAFAANAEGVKLLEVDGGDGCVAPSEETIADGSYPLSRPLFIYPSLQAADENPAVAPFVDFYLDEGYAAVSEVGYVALPEDQLGETRDGWTDR